MKLIQLPGAESEVDEAVEYYERQRPGLGLEFLDELRRGLDEVVANPNRWPRIALRVRRHRIDRFPYGIVYTVSADTVLVVSVMHLSRRPGYWRDRLG